MKNLAFPKKLLAAILSLLMVCTMLNCILLTATAADETIDSLIAAVNADGKVTQTEAVSVNTIVDLYNAMDATTQETYKTSVDTIKTAFYAAMTKGYTTFSGVSDFSFDQWAQLSYEDGYVRYKLGNSGGPGLRVGPRAMMAFDGLELMFNRVNQTSYTANFGIGIQLTPATANIASSSTYAPDFTLTKGILVYFDFRNGRVLYNLKKSNDASNVMYKELIKDDSLKLENIRYKAFTLGFVKGDAENPLNVVIKIADGSSPIVLPIPAEYYDESIIPLNGNVNVAINRGCYTAANGASSTSGAVNVQLDMVGYRNTKKATELVDAIKKLDVDTVSEADAELFYEAEDIFTELDKADIEYDALNAKLFNMAKDGYTFGNIAGYHAASILKNKSTYKTDDYAHFGIAYTSTSGGTSTPGVRAHDETAVAVDGFKMKFGGYKDTNAAAKSKGIAIQFHKAAGDQDLSIASANGVMLYVDILNGKLIYNLIVSGVRTVETLVADSDVIKGLHGKIFTLEINATTEAGYAYEVEIKTAAGDVQTAKIPASDSLATVMVGTNGKTYYGFARGAYLTATTGLPQPVGNEFDFFGHINTKNIRAAEKLIAKIPAEVTTNDGNAIFEAENVYATLSDYEKTCVDSAKIAAARTRYDELFTTETAALEYTVVTDSCLTAGMKVANVNGWWSSSSISGHKFAQVVDGNGIRVDWRNQGKANRLAIGTAVNMDGLSLRFNNFKRISGEKAELAMLFSRSSSNYHEGKDVPFFAVILDAAAGALKVSTKWVNSDPQKQICYDVIASDLLKYENLAGAKFTVDFEAIGEFEYKVTVTVAGESVSGIIPAKAFAEVSSAEVGTSLYNPNNCNFAVSAWSGNYQSVDVVGFKTEKTVQRSKIEGASLTISDSISVNYKVSAGILTANTYVNPEIDFTLANETITVKGEQEAGTGYYNFTFPNVAPNRIGQTITATLYAKRSEEGERILMGDTLEYSVEQYCYSMLEKYADNKELCDLVTDLLRYGAASQTYTGDDKDGLVTDRLTESQKAFGAAYTTATAGKVALTSDASYTAAGKQVTWNSASLYLLDVANIRFKFTVKDGVDVSALTVKATVGGNEYTVSADRIEQIGNSNSYYLYFDGATAVNMRDDVTVAFYDGETAVSKTANYSIEKYIGTQVDKNADANLVAMLKALLCYGDSATAYGN